MTNTMRGAEATPTLVLLLVVVPIRFPSLVSLLLLLLLPTITQANWSHGLDGVDSGKSIRGLWNTNRARKRRRWRYSSVPKKRTTTNCSSSSHFNIISGITDEFGRNMQYIGTSLSLSRDGSILAFVVGGNRSVMHEKNFTSAVKNGSVMVYALDNCGSGGESVEEVGKDGGMGGGRVLGASPRASWRPLPFLVIDDDAHDDENGEHAVSTTVSGFAVKVAGDGHRLVVGTLGGNLESTSAKGGGVREGQMRVYEYVNSYWKQVGNTLTKSSLSSSSSQNVSSSDEGMKLFGSSVSISHNGMRAVVGEPIIEGEGKGGSGGSVHVWEWSPALYSWIHLISIQSGNENEDSSLLFGWSTSISGDGSVLAVGAPKNLYPYQNAATFLTSQDNNTDSGSSKVMVYDIGSSDKLKSEGALEGTYTHLGDPIEAMYPSSAISDMWGFSLSVSLNGTYIAIGSPFSSCGDPRDDRCGLAAVYHLNGEFSWTLYGGLINEGFAESRNVGYSISLSDDGQNVLVGAPSIFKDDRLSEQRDHSFGRAELFYYQSNVSTWTRRNPPITHVAAGGGENTGHISSIAGDNLGYAVSLSGDGLIAVASAPQIMSYDDNENGYMQVYRVDSVSPVQQPSSAVTSTTDTAAATPTAPLTSTPSLHPINKTESVESGNGTAVALVVLETTGPPALTTPSFPSLHKPAGEKSTVSALEATDVSSDVPGTNVATDSEDGGIVKSDEDDVTQSEIDSSKGPFVVARKGLIWAAASFSVVLFVLCILCIAWCICVRGRNEDEAGRDEEEDESNKSSFLKRVLPLRNDKGMGGRAASAASTANTSAASAAIAVADEEEEDEGMIRYYHGSDGVPRGQSSSFEGMERGEADTEQLLDVRESDHEEGYDDKESGNVGQQRKKRSSLVLLRMSLVEKMKDANLLGELDELESVEDIMSNASCHRNRNRSYHWRPRQKSEAENADLLQQRQQEEEEKQEDIEDDNVRNRSPALNVGARQRSSGSEMVESVDEPTENNRRNGRGRRSSLFSWR